MKMASIYSQTFSLSPAFCYRPCIPKLNMKANEVSATTFNGKENGTAQSNSAIIGTNKSLNFAASMTKVATKLQSSRVSAPDQKQFVDQYRQGKFVEEKTAVYRQIVVIRSNEVDHHKTATLEAILNLLQDTSLNQGWMAGIYGDDYAATPGMQKHNLIWVVTKMKVEIDEYPVWGEVIEIDTWLGTTGKNGIKRDWIIKSQATKQVYIRATCTMVMMNKISRRLSKLPEEVRVELTPLFVERTIKEIVEVEKIDKLEDKAKYANRNLEPKRSDLDMNHHVNNVTYANWMLESIPESLLERYQLSSIALEFRRECEITEKVQSLSEPDEHNICELFNGTNIANGYPSMPNLFESYWNNSSLGFTHLLKGTVQNSKNDEIARGRTTWKRKF